MIFNYIYWNADPEIINVLGISVRYYGLLFVSGLILCIYLPGRIYKIENIPYEHLEKFSIYSMIGILVGARLGHCLFYEPSYYLSHPLILTGIGFMIYGLRSIKKLSAKHVTGK